MNRLVRLAGLYGVPIFSIYTFVQFVFFVSPPAQMIAWGAKHGVNEAIALHYPALNAVTLSGWCLCLACLLMKLTDFACLPAAMATGYVLCDISFYFPMARTAGERPPFDQLIIFVVQLAYVIWLFYVGRRASEQAKPYCILTSRHAEY